MEFPVKLPITITDTTFRLEMKAVLDFYRVVFLLEGFNTIFLYKNKLHRCRN